MKIHSTNYYNTFIAVADDCAVTTATIPPMKKEKTAANLQFEWLAEQPYQYTSDEVLFSIFATRQGIKKSELSAARSSFFSKGQACFRASPLGKRYGWGIHFNDEGKNGAGRDR